MVSKTQKIIFLLPPATASNSLVKTLLENSFEYTPDPKKYPVEKIHLKLDEIMDRYDIDSLDGYKVIQVSRDPYDRTISGYYHQMRIFKNPDVIGNISISGHTFDDFLSHLNSTINSENFIEDFYGDSSFVNYAISSKTTWGGTRFYQTQTSWKNVECDYYKFKLEDLTNDISPLSNLINLPLTPLLPINVNPLPVDYEIHKTEQNNLIIETIFADDFINFEY
jgi:hypothetical protein